MKEVKKEKFIEVIYKIIPLDSKNDLISQKLRTFKIEFIENYKEDFEKYVKHKIMSEIICLSIKAEELKNARNILLDIIVDGLAKLEENFDKSFQLQIIDEKQVEDEILPK